MRIGIVYNTCHYIVKFRLNLIDEIQKRDNEVIIFAPADKYTDQLKKMGFQFVEMPKIYSLKEVLFNGPLFFMRLINQSRSLKIDVVLSFTIFVNIASGFARLFMKTRVISNISGLGQYIIGNGAMTSFFVRSVYCSSQRLVDHVFFQNKDDQNLLVGSRPRNSSVLPGSGVDLNTFKFGSRDSSNVNCFTILFVGRLLYQKGILDYLEVAKRVLADSPGRPIQFKVIGEHEDRDEYISLQLLEKYLAVTGIDYLGPVHPALMPEIFGYSDCVVLPSVYGEGVPRCLLEGAASGNVLVGYDWRGVREIIEDGYNGFLADATDIQGLFLSMMKVINSSDNEIWRMKQSGRDLVECKFDERLVISRYLRKLEALH